MYGQIYTRKNMRIQHQLSYSLVRKVPQAAVLCAKLLRIPISLAAAYGISCTFGFPTTMLIPQEVSEAFGRNDKEKAAILNFLLPKMLTAGFVTVTIVSVLIAGAAVKML